ncbi:hypothetical protein NESM_000156000 [Novymonas esmeraldas]|uniref:Uncharacterized protein n=1 Tax=Novymonas esmeraldas TaxID=1808958 RepID=A0AAW0F771_9TRYP
MALHFSRAATQFVRNLVELGVCGNPDCPNAYRAPVRSHCRCQHSAPSSLQLWSTTPPQRHEGPLPATPPATPLDTHMLVEALDCVDFPLAAVGRQLSSSEAQMSQPLARYIDALFSRVSTRLHVRLETLVRALRLLEEVQLTNIRAYQRHLMSTPHPRSIGIDKHHNDHRRSSNGCSTVGGRLATARSPQAALRSPPLLPCPAPDLPPPHGASTCVGVARGPASAPIEVVRRHLPEVDSGGGGGCAAEEVLPLGVAGHADGAAPLPRLSGGWLHRPSQPSAAPASLLDGSATSADTFGPLTDTDGPQLRKGEAQQPSSLTSWCLPTAPPVEPVPCHERGMTVPLLNPPSPCCACRGTRVFALQYHNVHLLLAACLVLSISINEVALMESVTEDALVHEVAKLSECTDVPLHVAVRVVCETLGGHLCVFDGDVDVLVRRLNVMETCVFASDNL